MTEQMDCQKYRAHLDEWIDGELDAELLPSMEAHRNACPNCAEETRRMLETIELIQTLEDEVPVPLETQAAWRSAIREEAKQRRRYRFSAGMRTASSIAAAFVLLIGCTISFRSAGLLDETAPAIQTVSIQSESKDRTYRRIGPGMNGGITYGMNRGRAVPYAYVASDGGDGVQATSTTAEDDLAAVKSDADANDVLLIRSVERTIATGNFDATAQSIRDLADQYGGYLENDAVTTQQDGLRSGELTAVISALEADSFLQMIEHVGNVTYAAEHYEDVSASIRDASARMDVLEAELERLQELIASAASADELSQLNALIQSTLTEIDSLQAESNQFTAEVDNVRISIHLEELHASATAEPTVAPSLPQRMSAAFGESARNLQLFVHDMAVSLMIIAPFALALLGVAVIVVAIVLTIRHHRKKRKHNS